MSKNISLQEAKRIIEKHKIFDTMQETEEMYSGHQVTDLELCTLAMMKILNSNDDMQIINQIANDYSVDVSYFHSNERFVIKKDKASIEFQRIPALLLKASNAKKNDCYMSCIGFAMLTHYPTGKIRTGEVAVVDLSEKNIPGVLHSFIEIDDTALDISNGFSMPIGQYVKAFHYKSITALDIEDVVCDSKNGNIKKMSNYQGKDGENIATELYLMARPDTIKLISEKTK